MSWSGTSDSPGFASSAGHEKNIQSLAVCYSYSTAIMDLQNLNLKFCQNLVKIVSLRRREKNVTQGSIKNDFIHHLLK